MSENTTRHPQKYSLFTFLSSEGKFAMQNRPKGIYSKREIPSFSDLPFLVFSNEPRIFTSPNDARKRLPWSLQKIGYPIQKIRFNPLAFRKSGDHAKTSTHPGKEEGFKKNQSVFGLPRQDHPQH